MPVFNIDFEPVGRRGSCASDQSLDIQRQLNVDLVGSPAGGNCERCKVQNCNCTRAGNRIWSQRRSLSKSELNQAYRLACQTYPLHCEICSVHRNPLTALPARNTAGKGHFEVDVTPKVSDSLDWMHIFLPRR